jgi:hypothetical protein
LEALKAAGGKTDKKSQTSAETNPTTTTSNRAQETALAAASSTPSSTSQLVTVPSGSSSVTVQTVIPAKVKLVTANGISKPIQVQGTLRMRRASIGESVGSSGISLLSNAPQHVRIKSESSSLPSSTLTISTKPNHHLSDSEYSEPKEPQVQIIKTDHTSSTATVPASGLIMTNRKGTTLLQQPILTLAGKQLVYKSANGQATTIQATPSNCNKNSLLEPPAKRKRVGESGVTIIAANVGQLINK